MKRWGGKILCTSRWVACTIFFWSRMQSSLEARKLEVGFQVRIAPRACECLEVLLGGGNRNVTPHGLEMLVFALFSQLAYVHGRSM